MRRFMYGRPSRGAKETRDAIHELCYGDLGGQPGKERAVLDEATGYLLREARERPTRALTGLIDESYRILSDGCSQSDYLRGSGKLIRAEELIIERLERFNKAPNRFLDDLKR